jgi:3-hydroxyisobutyrate dehydrogenase-like beta-hydroxyacid dehydrogenase
MSMRVGFIGVGTIGKPMAANVARAGFDLMVYDLREEPLKSLRELGATIAGSPKEVGEHCDIIEIAVVDDAEVEIVLNGTQGVFEGACPNSVVAVHSTISPETVRRLAEIARLKGIKFLEAPVSGGRKGAEDRDLCYVLGGEKDVVEKCKPLFSTSGSHLFHMGELGTASMVKIIQQAVVCINMLAAHEAETLCDRTGIGFDRFLEILHVSSGQSFASDHWIERFKRPHDSISTRRQRTEVFKRSLSPALELAERFGVSVPGAALAQQRLGEIMGIASEDS